MLMISNIHSDAKIEREDHTDIQTIVAQAISYSGIEQRTRPTNKEAAVTLKVQIDAATNALSVLTHKLHASRLLAQLLENAAKFTHEGTISLQAEAIDGLVRFIVEDTGIGIPADESEHIFDEFVQLNEFADGTGIGLTVARSVALRLGGDLRVDTDYKQGARFVFELLRY